MTRPVEEVGVPERDVPRACSDELPDVCKDNVPRHDEVPSAIDGRDRTVQALMQTPAARLDVARGDQIATARQTDVAGERRERLATGDRKGQALESRRRGR